MARSCSWGTGGANRNQKLTNSLLEQKHELLSTLVVPAAAERCASRLLRGSKLCPHAPAPSEATILGAVNCSTPTLSLVLVEFFVSSWSMRRQFILKEKVIRNGRSVLCPETLCSSRFLIIFI